MSDPKGHSPPDVGRTLCFGGSFNPIHNGHLVCAKAVAERAGFDRVVLIPSAQPPHKPGVTDLAPAGDRVEMCRIAVQDSPLFSVNDLETRRNGPSYTIDTARELKREGWGEVNWLIGGDMLAILPQWHEAKILIREVNFVIMARPGWAFDWGRLPSEFRALEKNVVEAPLIDISATDIRARARKGERIDQLTPKGVCDYIETQKLYRPA